MTSRFASWAHRHMPTREQMERNRFIRPFAHRVLRSELWRFTRRSVPRGVALGLLVGIIIPFAQIVFAALLAAPVRANVPLAALVTFVTNPLTTPFIWLAANAVGHFFLRIDAAMMIAPVNTAISQTDLQRALVWLTQKGIETAVGLVVIAVVTASISYLASGWFWRWRTGRRRRARLERARVRRAAHG